MSEYWVSKKKYFCKYCDIYIADDVPSRQHHENGLRHKGSVERYVRGIYKAGAQKKKDVEEEKREMARVEQAAQAAFAQDVSQGNAKATSAPVASTSSAPRKPPTKPSSPWANYTTAAQLGINDPDAERLELQKSQGLVGEWQVVEPSPASLPLQDSQEEDGVKPDVGAGSGSGTATRITGESSFKRPAEVPPEEDTRSFKLQKKTTTVGLGEIYDPGLIPVKLKKKEETGQVPEPSISASNTTSGPLKWTSISLKSKDTSSTTVSPSPISSASPSISKTEESNGALPPPDAENQEQATASRWSKVKWDQPLKEEEAAASLSQTSQQPSSSALPGSLVKAEEDGKLIKTEGGGTPVATEPSTTGLFKKRKAPVGTGRGRR